MKLFLSYARDDADFVHQLAEGLRDDAQHQVWGEGRSLSNERWWDMTLDQIEAAECFIVVLTPRAAASTYCLAALDYAIQWNKPILPLVLRMSDMPPALVDAPVVNVAGSLAETHMAVERALSRIQVLRYQGEFGPPARVPARPAQPELQPDDPDYVFEQYHAAEEAAAVGNMDLAERLFGKVAEADPIGLGALANSRLAEIHHVRSQKTAYERIEKLVADPETFENAKAAWRMYLARYGRLYDPRNFTALFTDRSGKTAPLKTRPLNKNEGGN
ncbi:MAG: toll/interleukin-1 receptor domain-containing protein [Anaerolineae bacterium]|nr:toll/interleukin-1 receptor domain-containing protein [Anaerolineae bacterium]